MMLKVLTLCLAATACNHRAVRPTVAAAAAAPAADPALLNDVDVRLLTEALAYDVTHSPWLQGLQAVQATPESRPQVWVGAMPQEVPPSNVPFPKEAFGAQLVQSLRNTHRVDVVTAAPGPEAGPLWQLQVHVSHDSAAIEGEMSRGYRLDAVLRLSSSGAAAWEKSYTLRKRLRPEARDGDTPPKA